MKIVSASQFNLRQMPPKKGNKDPGPAKIKPDLSFGLKNKNKSAKVQARVQELNQQAAMRGKGKEAQEKEKEKAALAARKEAEKKKKDEVASLFTPLEIVQPKVPFGVDPKSVLCAFHKAGRCQKGSKCKFSHDLGQERKQQKASIYADQRDESKEQDTMDKWTDEKLQEVVSRKGNPKATTDVVCKFFIAAVESGKYGWFWECPNGDDCMYRHRLPPGFVLKSQKKKEEEDAKRKEITLEEFLDVERHKLDQSKLTPLTKETFAEWKKNRVSKQAAVADAATKTKQTSAAMGKVVGLSGRDLFTFNPDLGLDSDEEEDGDDEWDITLLRVRKEQEDRQNERERIRMLHDFGGLSLEDAEATIRDQIAMEKKEEAEREAAATTEAQT